MKCNQSDVIVGRAMCETMPHIRQSDRKITDNDNGKMLNDGLDNRPGQIIGSPIISIYFPVRFSSFYLFIPEKSWMRRSTRRQKRKPWNS